MLASEDSYEEISNFCGCTSVLDTHGDNGAEDDDNGDARQSGSEVFIDLVHGVAKRAAEHQTQYYGYDEQGNDRMNLQLDGGVDKQCDC